MFDQTSAAALALSLAPAQPSAALVYWRRLTAATLTPGTCPTGLIQLSCLDTLLYSTLLSSRLVRPSVWRLEEKLGRDIRFIIIVILH